MKSSADDIPEIFRLYRLATDYQKKTFPENLWPQFEDELVRSEIAEGRQYKIVLAGEIACIWAVSYSDPVIWAEDDGQSAIYIHRIATNPDFRGNNFVKIIVDWAKKSAEKKGKKFVRLDTCGNNTRLINHYQNSGFDFLGMKKLQNSEGLPTHYDNADVCYFEIKIP